MLKEKLKNTKMAKLDIVTSYLTKITQVHDKFAIVGETVTNGEMVSITHRRKLFSRVSQPISSQPMTFHFLIMICHMLPPSVVEKS